MMHNCVDIGTPFNLPYQSDAAHVRIQLTRNTILATGFGIQVGEITERPARRKTGETDRL